jgi:hypothetical protein
MLLLLLELELLLAPFAEAGFLAGAGLALFAADRVVGAALSLELELERALSPLADDEVSPLLFDRSERLSTGIFLGFVLLISFTGGIEA